MQSSLDNFNTKKRRHQTTEIMATNFPTVCEANYKILTKILANQ